MISFFGWISLRIQKHKNIIVTYVSYVRLSFVSSMLHQNSLEFTISLSQCQNEWLVSVMLSPPSTTRHPPSFTTHFPPPFTSCHPPPLAIPPPINPSLVVLHHSPPSTHLSPPSLRSPPLYPPSTLHLHSRHQLTQGKQLVFTY